MKNPVGILLTIILFIAVSCGGKQAIYEGTAEQLNSEVIEELNKERGFTIFGGTNYDKVFDILKEIQIRYPYTKYAALAELRSGDVYFKKKEYTTAAEEYENFITNHPGHEELDYAMYRLGLSYYKMKAGKDRNHSKPLNAIRWFTLLRETYPDSEYVEQTQDKIEKSRSMLAEREIYIGKFYQKKKNYEAALQRYRNVLENYSDTEYSEKARKLLQETQEKLSGQSS
ncbi:MAG: outer membrane protein assembly factor BamD [Candidatus Dadabacteria bacterium]|nr:outer membrane protein assembly factor BamD [Candidatus Dadabacteria bacterium]MCY4263123.1 outer membrane protein assembly factor BamD [Candidatus Dadabacteria bacterium]